MILHNAFLNRFYSFATFIESYNNAGDLTDFKRIFVVRTAKVSFLNTNFGHFASE